MIIAGPFTLPNAAVAGRVFAQSRDITRPLTNEELAKVVQSERIHSLYQALSRGSCRIMRDGKAQAMEAYVLTPEPLSIKTSLRTVMPGVVFKGYKPKHLKAGCSKKAKCKESLLLFLQDTTEDKLSTAMLFKKAVPDVKGDTRKVALKELLDDELTFD